MKFKINQIGLFSKEKKDIVEFNDGVSIISGTSKTGKSSIGKIINYCLGASKNIIPAGIIRDSTEIYSISITIDNKNLIIARNRFDEFEKNKIKGSNYIFLEYFDNEVSLNDISYSYFLKNDNKYITIKDFLELEIIKYFPSFPPKTRKDGQEYVRPTIRNMTPFIFQSQDIICSDKTLFYDMNNPNKIRGIIRDFQLFLGLVSNDVYNKINRKNELIKLIKKLKSKHELYKEELEKEIKKLKGHYNRLYSHLNVTIDIEEIAINELLDEDKLNNLKIEYKLKSDSSKKYQKLREECNLKSRVIEKIKIECSNIENQINNINKTSLSLSSLNNSNEEHKNCPLCDSPTNDIFKPFIEAKKKIVSEQNFLNTYNQDILNDKFEARKEELESYTKDFKISLVQLQELKKDINEIKSMEESIALQNEIKGLIKASIKNIEEFNKINADTQKLIEMEEELEELEKKLSKINIKRKIQEAENQISQYATDILKKLPFGSDEYGEANLKFTIKDISFYQQNKDSILYMYEMGSAENYLACHLAIFLGLHRFIQKNTNSILPSLIFLDQPSQVYFPEEKDFVGDEISGDMKKVRDIYKTLINSVDEWNNEENIQIQMIIVDHFYDKDAYFQKKLLENRWDKEKGIGLIKRNM